METSPPAQNARPMPVTTMTAMAGSVLQPRRVSIEVESNSVLSAFSFSGRLKARVAIRSVTLARIMIETNIANGCGVKRNREPVNAPHFFTLFACRAYDFGGLTLFPPHERYARFLETDLRAYGRKIPKPCPLPPSSLNPPHTSKLLLRPQGMKWYEILFTTCVNR